MQTNDMPPPKEPTLTEEQKREALLIVSIGCDPTTAAQYVGASTEAITAAIAADTDFAEAMTRAEATAEMTHMRNVQQAAKEDKNWRASVWWLERRLPDRYARRDKNAVGPSELRDFLIAVAEAIADEVGSEDDRQRLLDRLHNMGGPVATSSGQPGEGLRDGEDSDVEAPDGASD